jgi:hypothetical protein
MSKKPNVGYVRPELEAKLEEYQTIRDCMEGEYAIKGERSKNYLPDPDPMLDDPVWRDAIYKGYLMRPPWYGVSLRTRNALVGEVFKREPIINLPSGLEILRDDIDGNGVTMIQQMRKSLCEIIDIGRGGLLVDYTATGNTGDGVVTLADVESGNVRPVIVRYNAEDIVNWREMRIGSKTVLSKVVLRETFVAEDDDYEEKLGEQRREFSLEMYEGGMFVNCLIWRKLKDAKTGEEEWVKVSEFPIIDHSGKAFDEIPFYPFGSEDNNWTMDPCPMSPITCMNLAHFRVSADLYNSAFKMGMPQLKLHGVDKDWIDTQMGGRIITGSNKALLLPATTNGAEAGILVCPENTLITKLIAIIEEQLVSLAAKMVKEGLISKTATQVATEASSETATLTNYANNDSMAYKKALKAAAKFTGDNPDEVYVKLNTQFNFTEADSQRLLAYVTAKDSGTLALEEVRDRLIEEGVATMPYAEFKKAMESQPDYSKKETTSAAGGGAAQEAAMAGE